MLKIEDLSVSIGDRQILNGVNIEIKQGEVHALLGSNGSGKSTLLSTIMGYPQFKVTSGRIIFKGQDITNMTVDERARLGVGISVQKPPAIKGITLQDAVQMTTGLSGNNLDVTGAANRLDVSYLLDRDLNLGYSGGEAKRSELLQLLAQSPDLIMFDEPESGVDLVNIGLVGNAINELLHKNELRKGPRAASGLIITHTGFILEYVNADKGHILCDGSITCSGNPRDMLEHIRQFGYDRCRICPSPNGGAQ
ncbi:MAG: ABC transporter ATP-binding protein [Armatimonadota bacterium]|nr:ABC transporter ATP-binding protein [bacterium]